MSAAGTSAKTPSEDSARMPGDGHMSGDGVQRMSGDERMSGDGDDGMKPASCHHPRPLTCAAPRPLTYAAPRPLTYGHPPTSTLTCEKSARTKHADLIIAALALFVVVAATVSLLLGRYPIDPAQAVGMIASTFLPIDQSWTDQQATMFFNVRLPRILLALMVGCCLSVAGAAYQGTFQNPLVSPDILGASQGAAFGAAVGILLGLASAGAFQPSHSPWRCSPCSSCC